MLLEAIKKITSVVIWIALEHHFTTISKNKVIISLSYVITLIMGKTVHLLVDTNINIPITQVLTQLKIVF